MENKKDKNPLLTILVVMITIGAGFLLIKQFQIQEQVDKMVEQPETKIDTNVVSPYYPKAKENYSIVEYPFGDFTANLAHSSGPQRFLNVRMVFLMETPTNDKLREIINNAPTLRDEIINIFNTTEARDVLKLEGREVLKNLLEKHINHKLKTDQVRRILFTQFLVK